MSHVVNPIGPAVYFRPREELNAHHYDWTSMKRTSSTGNFGILLVMTRSFDPSCNMISWADLHTPWVTRGFFGVIPVSTISQSKRTELATRPVTRDAQSVSIVRTAHSNLKISGASIAMFARGVMSSLSASNSTRISINSFRRSSRLLSLTIGDSCVQYCMSSQRALIRCGTMRMACRNGQNAADARRRACAYNFPVSGRFLP